MTDEHTPRPDDASSQEDSVSPRARPVLNIPMARPARFDQWGENEASTGIPGCSDRGRSPFPPSLPPLRATVELLSMVAIGLGSMIGLHIIIGVLFPDLNMQWTGMAVTVIVASILILATFGYVIRDRHSLKSIGLRSGHVPTEIGIAVSATIITYLFLILINLIMIMLDPSWIEKRMKSVQNIEESIPSIHIGYLLLMMVFVAFWEELIFRGFLLTRLYAIFRRWWLAVPIGAFLFTLGHDYQGETAIVPIFGLGVAMSLIFLWRKSLLPCIIYHFLVNSVSILLLYYGSESW